jgi:hypothetical protein
MDTTLPVHPSDCCPPAVQATCCAATEKTECCGSDINTGGCGCTTDQHSIFAADPERSEA